MLIIPDFRGGAWAAFAFPHLKMLLFLLVGIIAGERRVSAFDQDQLTLQSLEAGTGIVGLRSSASGIVVAGGGDFNGDGIEDILIGNLAEGEVILLFGGEGNSKIGSINLDLVSSRKGSLHIKGLSTDCTGWSVSSLGDVNSDGFDDLIIGSPCAPSLTGAMNAGRTYIIFGKSALSSIGTMELDDMDVGQGLVIGGAAEGDHTGSSVKGAGDVNADGIPDVLIGAPSAESSTGSVYVLFGKVGMSSVKTLNLDNPPVDSVLKIHGIYPGDNLGDTNGVSGLGDVNGDGISDFIMGAKWANALGKQYAGQAYIIYGGSKLTSLETLKLADLTFDRGFVIYGEEPYDNAGCSVSGAGDVNGDGYADILIGADQANSNGNLDTGKAYIIFGSPGLSSSSFLDLSSLALGLGLTINGINPGDYTGVSVSDAGDVNGDGFADVVIGADWAAADSLGFAGQVYVVFGNSDLSFQGALNLESVTKKTGLLLKSNTASSFTGQSVAGAVDFDNDGVDDILVGASKAMYVVFGSSKGEIVYTASPTSDPTKTPTSSPTFIPTSMAPTSTPTMLSREPSGRPTVSPITMKPSLSPSTLAPTQAPLSEQPTTAAPSTQSPNTASPTTTPTAFPSTAPTLSPSTKSPTRFPSLSPSTCSPSLSPIIPLPDSTLSPSSAPSTNRPSISPSVSPTSLPSLAPTHSPSSSPSTTPSTSPSFSPSASPLTSAPTTLHPTRHPSPFPSPKPSSCPSFSPTSMPTDSPSLTPSAAPITGSPSRGPSTSPTSYPTSTCSQSQIDVSDVAFGVTMYELSSDETAGTGFYCPSVIETYNVSYRERVAVVEFEYFEVQSPKQGPNGMQLTDYLELSHRGVTRRFFGNDLPEKQIFLGPGPLRIKWVSDSQTELKGWKFKVSELRTLPRSISQCSLNCFRTSGGNIYSLVRIANDRYCPNNYCSFTVDFGAPAALEFKSFLIDKGFDRLDITSDGDMKSFNGTVSFPKSLESSTGSFFIEWYSDEVTSQDSIGWSFEVGSIECDPGFYELDATCRQCPPAHTSSRGSTECIRCETGALSNLKRTQCEVCAGASRPGRNLTTCECLKGYYTDPGKIAEEKFEGGSDLKEKDVQVNCIKCPEEAQCEEFGLELSQVYPKPGYWEDIWSEDLAYLKCRNNGCPGHQSGCTDGYQDDGILCTECESGYGRSGDYYCQECPPASLAIFQMLGSWLLISLVGMGLAYNQVRAAEIASAGVEEDYSSVLVRIALNTLQVNSLAYKFEYTWPAFAEKFFYVEGAVGVTFGYLLSVDCVTSPDSSVKPFYLNTVIVCLSPFFIPLLALLVVVLYTHCNCCMPHMDADAQADEADVNDDDHVISTKKDSDKSPLPATTANEPDREVEESKLRTRSERRRRSGRHSYGSFTLRFASWEKDYKRKVFNARFKAASMALMFALFPSLVLQTFRLFSCEELSEGQPDSYRLISDMSQRCYMDAHLKFVLLLGVPMLIWYVIGFPAASLVWLRQANENMPWNLNAESDAKKYFTRQLKALPFYLMYRGYLPQFYCYEVVVLVRKVLIVCFGVFISDVSFQSAAAVLLIVISLLLLAKFTLFDNNLCHYFEFAGLGSSFVTFFLGWLLSTDGMSQDAKMIASMIVVGVNVLFFFVVSMFVARDLMLCAQHSFRLKEHNVTTAAAAARKSRRARSVDSSVTIEGKKLSLTREIGKREPSQPIEMSPIPLVQQSSHQRRINIITERGHAEEEASPGEVPRKRRPPTPRRQI